MSSSREKKRPGPSQTPGVEVLEKNTETAWGLFQSLQEQPVPAPPAEITLDTLLTEVRRNNRVCPRPAVWKKLYDYLPNKTEQLAPAPVTLEEWNMTPPLQKRARLRQHIEWAAAQGVLKQVHKALMALPEEKWLHMGD